MGTMTPTTIAPVGNGTSQDSRLQRHSEILEPEIILDRECQHLRDLIEISHEMKQALTGLGVGTAGYNFTIKSYHLVQQDIQKQQQRVETASANLLQHIQEREHKLRWRELYDRLLQQLMAAYGHLGPQYQLLVRRLAFAEVKLEQMEEAGARDSNEWRRAAREVRDLIASLQKYTEAEKKEVVSAEVQEAVLAVLEIVGNHISNRYPLVWQAIVHEVETRVGEAEDE